MASGTGGQIAFSRLSSLYAIVDSVDVATNFVSETLEHKLAELEEGSITGRRDAPPSHEGIDMGDGDINFEPNPNPWSFLTQAFFGVRQSSLVTDAASLGANSGDEAGKPQWYHIFTPRQDPFSNRTFLDPMNFMVYRDVQSAFLFRGSIVPTYKLEITAGALTKSSISIMARQVDLIQRTGAISSLAASCGGRPWVWDMTSIEVSTDTSCANLVANVNYEKLNIAWTLPNEGVVLLDGTKRYAEFAPNQFRRIAIDGTLSFRDETEYLAFKAYENRRMRITLLNVNSRLILGNPASADATKFLGYYGLRIHMPQVKYLQWNAPIGGPNRLTASFTAKAEYDCTEGIMSEIDMMNKVSAGSLYATQAPSWSTVVASPARSYPEADIVTGSGQIQFYVDTTGGETFNAAPNSATIYEFLQGYGGEATVKAALTTAVFSLVSPNEFNVKLPAVGAFPGVLATTTIPWTVPTSMFTNRTMPYVVSGAFTIVNSV